VEDMPRNKLRLASVEIYFDNLDAAKAFTAVRLASHFAVPVHHVEAALASS
jgi:hypothetical protein